MTHPETSKASTSRSYMESTMTNKRPAYGPAFNIPPVREEIIDQFKKPLTTPARTTYDESRENLTKGKGVRKPLETVRLPAASPDGSILIISLTNPQLWPETLNRWEVDAARAYMNKTASDNDIDMFSYLETLLGDTALSIYNEAKRIKSAEIENIRKLGNNPYNFTRLIRSYILGFDPTRENTNLQDIAIRELEQLSITDWRKITEFSNDYMHYASQAGKYFDEDIANRYLRKLPGELGKKIEENFKNKLYEQGLGVGPRIWYTFEELRQRCSDYLTQKQPSINGLEIADDPEELNMTQPAASEASTSRSYMESTMTNKRPAYGPAFNIPPAKEDIIDQFKRPLITPARATYDESKKNLTKGKGEIQH
ncbi:hypothetical protein RJ641_024416 [Dillenia turbinata]|uniref:Uncharacterized protein n=1 Tax=Dillenia turbinata TaxID=194707 RepID=A0AAN8VZP6_9MAGN